MEDVKLTYSHLLCANQDAFALRYLSEAIQALKLALLVALTLRDEQKLSEIELYAREQMEEVLAEPFPHLSCVELDDYNSIIEMICSYPLST